MAIRFFFEYEDLVIQLPVNPAELRVQSEGDNETVNIVKLGEVNIIKQKTLDEVEVESFLPKYASAPYVLTYGEFEEPQFYIDYFNRVREDKKPLRFIVSDTKINMLASIEEFEYGLDAQDDDTHYKLVLKEYKNYSSKVVKIKQDETTKKTVVKTTTTTRPKTGFAIGDTVIANGRYYYSSWGVQPSYVFPKDFVGKISHIVNDKTRAFPIHITTLTGGYRGWVKESQIKHK